MFYWGFMLVDTRQLFKGMSYYTLYINVFKIYGDKYVLLRVYCIKI